jgi:hypothetical protein
VDTQCLQAGEQKLEHTTVESTQHKLHSGHTVRTGRITETGAHNVIIYTEHAEEWAERGRETSRNRERQTSLGQILRKNVFLYV